MPRGYQLPLHLESQDPADAPADQLIGPGGLKFVNKLHVLGGDLLQRRGWRAGSGKLTIFTDPGGRQSKVTISGTTNQLTYDSLSSPTAKGNSTTFVYRAYPGTQTAVLFKRIRVILDTTIVTYDSAGLLSRGVVPPV